jgi:hypothetical protein
MGILKKWYGREPEDGDGQAAQRACPKKPRHREWLPSSSASNVRLCRT